MDDYLDLYFNSSSWSDVNVRERSSWDHGEPDQPNELLPSSPVSMISSNHSLECLAEYSTPSLVPREESGSGVEHGLLSGEVGLQMNGKNCSSNSSKEMYGSLGFGNLGLKVNTAVHSSGSMSLGSLKDLPVTGDMTPSLSFNERGHMICNGGESSKFRRSVRGLETLSPSPPLWHLQPYDSVSSLPTLMEQTRMQSSYLQGDNGNVDNECSINRFIEIDKILQPENLSASLNAKGKQDMQNSLYSSFSADHQITKTMIGLPSLLQSASPTPNNGCNGIGKPRIRARRGQATDPHSIAERLRREKIAERMKNLQELVPNSNKVSILDGYLCLLYLGKNMRTACINSAVFTPTQFSKGQVTYKRKMKTVHHSADHREKKIVNFQTDKASMLDEIIAYVKFLQLQVKVLSISRLGAAGAVIPLITDGQAEGSNALSLTTLAGQEVDFSPSPDQVVYEQEVVKLMESNMTMAMQYLQNKGLCLMPIALAGAMSNGKASSSSSSSSSSSAPASEERKKIGFANSLVNNDIVHGTCSSSRSSSNSSGSLPGAAIHQMTSDGNFMMGKLGAGIMTNGCNGTFKQEELNTLCTTK